MTQEKEPSKVYRTHQIWVKKGHQMYPYFQTMTQNAKNLYNTTNFYIRQVYTALTQNKAWQPTQQEVMAIIDRKLPFMNEVQLKAYHKNVAIQQAKPKDKRKEVRCNLFAMPSAEKPYVSYAFLDALFKATAQENYRSLPTQSSQGVMKSVFANWKSFFASLRDYKVDPSKYKGKPRIPSYCRAKEKDIVFSNQDCVMKQGKFLKFPKTKNQLNIGKLGMDTGKFKQVRVIPAYNAYVVEIIMEYPKETMDVQDNGRYMAIDLGIDNLATIVTNTGQRPLLVKGKHVKSINQYYNKRKAQLLSILRQGKSTKEGPYTSKQLKHLQQTRHVKIKDIFHKVSKFIVYLALEENIKTIIIGQNKAWKQLLHIGKRNNQSFVSIPHGLLIQMVQYKAAMVGIQVIVTEESYTSKASFLDDDIIPTYGEVKGTPTFAGKRISRGLYRSRNQVLVNADVNGAANILKKAVLRVTNAATFLIESVNVHQPCTKII